MSIRRTLLLAALLATSQLATPASAQTDTTKCPQCVIPKKIGRAAWELVLVQLIPWSFNHFVRDAEWAEISPAVWWTNLQNPWQWDNNAFLNNQFSHPYHGSLYYNVARIYAQAIAGLDREVAHNRRTVSAPHKDLQDRARAALSKSLDLLPAQEAARFWQNVVQTDKALRPLQGSHWFRQLASRYPL